MAQMVPIHRQISKDFEEREDLKELSDVSEQIPGPQRNPRHLSRPELEQKRIARGLIEI